MWVLGTEPESAYLTLSHLFSSSEIKVKMNSNLYSNSNFQADSPEARGTQSPWDYCFLKDVRTEAVAAEKDGGGHCCWPLKTVMDLQPPMGATEHKFYVPVMALCPITRE